MSHTLKILFKVLPAQIKPVLHNEINESQYGFTPDKGTRNAIFIFRMLSERCIEVNRDVYCCFVDYTKAFDRVQHNILFELLSDLDITDKDLRIIQNMYFNQQAVVRLDEMSEPVSICRGVRQGCVMSPDLFSYYSEVIVREASGCRGVMVGGLNLSNIRYADDTALLTSSERERIATSSGRCQQKKRKMQTV